MWAVVVAVVLIVWAETKIGARRSAEELQSQGRITILSRSQCGV